MKVNPGLEGVMVAETEISLIDGQAGRLIIRGYDVKELAIYCSFEEMVYLLWTGKRPEAEELNRWKEQQAKLYPSFAEITERVRQIPRQADMMSVIRAVLLSVGDQEYNWPPTQEKGLRLLAKIPFIVAARYRWLQGRPFVAPNPALSFAANYLYMIHGEDPHPAHVKALESYLVLTAEHGLNASTFTARVVASTEADLISAIIAALGALKGRLHGGAPSEVDDMLEQISSLDRAETWMREKLDQGGKLMGFGHRLYKTIDPRAEALREVVQSGSGSEPWFQLAIQVEQIALALLKQYKPHRQLHTNVEFYTAAILKAIQLPKELYTPTFAISRTAGWIAHVMEQAKNNRIIRPDAKYVGPERVER